MRPWTVIEKWMYDVEAAPYSVPLDVSYIHQGKQHVAVLVRYKYPNGEEGWDLNVQPYAWRKRPVPAPVPSRKEIEK